MSRTIRNIIIPRVYNKEGGRVSYTSIVPCTAIVRVQARLMISTMCGTFTVYTTNYTSVFQLVAYYSYSCKVFKSVFQLDSKIDNIKI